MKNLDISELQHRQNKLNKFHHTQTTEDWGRALKNTQRVKKRKSKTLKEILQKRFISNNSKKVSKIINRILKPKSNILKTNVSKLNKFYNFF